MSDNADVVMLNTEFVNNSANGEGGALHLEKNVTLTVSNCSFTNNRATSAGALGAGWNVSIQLDNCSFQKNRAKFVGGAIVLTKNISLYMRNSLILHNTCQLGASLFAENRTNIHLEKTRIINNTGSYSVKQLNLYE